MLDKIKALLLQKFLKGTLDKLPLNGKKTLTGFCLLVLSAALAAFPHVIPDSVSQALFGLLKDAGAPDWSELTVGTAVTGLITWVIGLLHRDLKAQADGGQGGGPAK
jgi:hypothetical protein